MIPFRCDDWENAGATSLFQITFQRPLSPCIVCRLHPFLPTQLRKGNRNNGKFVNLEALEAMSYQRMIHERVAQGRRTFLVWVAFGQTKLNAF